MILGPLHFFFLNVHLLILVLFVPGLIENFFLLVNSFDWGHLRQNVELDDAVFLPGEPEYLLRLTSE